MQPTEYDRIQNQWVWFFAVAWGVSIIASIATTADIVSGATSKEVIALRERVAVLESKLHEDRR